MDDKLFDACFQLRFQGKQCERAANKCEGEAQRHKKRVVDALRKGEPEKARIYAADAVRKHSEGVNLLRMAQRLDIVQGRLRLATATKTMVKEADTTAKLLGKYMSNLDVLKMSATCDAFAEKFEDVEVRGEALGTTLEAVSTPANMEEETDRLVAQMADEVGLHLTRDLPAFQFTQQGRKELEEEEAQAVDLPPAPQVLPSS